MLDPVEEVGRHGFGQTTAAHGESTDGGQHEQAHVYGRRRSRWGFKDYYPAWIDNLADDVTVEGSLLDGAAEGPEGVRTIVGTIRTLYEHQEFNFAGPYGDNGWLEDYTAQVGGEPIGCAVLVTSNDAGQTQHVAANYRPRSSLLLMSRLLSEKFAGTPYAQYFLSSES